MNKVIGIIIAIVLIVGIIALVKKGENDPVVDTLPSPTNNLIATSTNATSTDMTTATSTKTYTMAEVATHANATSCFSVISNKVYDLTKWIPQHPGGPEKILQICGKDGTSLFMGQHGASAQIVAGLQNFYIGNLQ